MNPGLVVKLRPAGPWRIGPDSGARNRVDSIYHSDSLYSAVSSAMARLGSLDDWLSATVRAADTAVSFSSCFPFLDEIGFVVPPRTIWPPATPALMAARVRWKSARFVPLGVVQAMLAGQTLKEQHWTVDGPSQCLVPAGRPGPFRIDTRWNAAVDRLSGSSERHSTACLEFRPGAGLWTVVSFLDDAARDRWLDPVKAAFRLLADTGFGGERSRGWGRSETPEFIEGQLPDMILPPAPARVEPAPAAAQPEVEVEPVASAEPAAAPVPAEAQAQPEAVAQPEASAEPAAAPAPTEEPSAAESAEIVAGEAFVEAPPDIAPLVVEPEGPPTGAAVVEALPAEPQSEEPAAAVAPEPEASEPEAAAPLEPAPAPPAPDASAADRPVAEASAPEPAPAPEPEVAAPAEEVRPVVAEPAPAPSAPGASVPDRPVAEAAAPEPAPASEPVVAAPAEEVRPVVAEPAPVAVATPEGVQLHWLLSLFSPAPGDAVDWTRGNYSVQSRGGRVESSSGSGELKKLVQMVTEGSVLYGGGALTGAAPDVAPDGFAHPVFRAGFAVAIPLPGVRS